MNMSEKSCTGKTKTGYDLLNSKKEDDESGVQLHLFMILHLNMFMNRRLVPWKSFVLFVG